MAQSKKIAPAARRAIDARRGIARQDMATGLAGLFSPKIQGKRMWIEGLRQKWKGGVLEFAGPELDAFDLLVMLALLALALREHQAGATEGAAGEKTGIVPSKYRKDGNAALNEQVIGLRTSMAHICRLIGRDPGDGSAHAAIKASIKRLSAVIVEARAGDEWATSSLINGAAGKGRKAVSVTINWRLTRAALGEGGSYTRIDVQRLSLLSPVARVLAAWLACWAPTPRACPPVTIDALTRHVWVEPAKTDSQQRDRRRLLSEAIATLPRDEWRVAIQKGEDGGTARIERLPDHLDACIGG
jgi:hypothetical protein